MCKFAISSADQGPETLWLLGLHSQVGVGSPLWTLPLAMLQILKHQAPKSFQVLQVN